MLGPSEQSGERSATRGIVDGTAHTARLSKSGSADKRTERLTRFARRGVDDAEVGLGQRNENLAHRDSILRISAVPMSRWPPGLSGYAR